MIRLNALRLLEKRGKTKYWLYKQLGMSYQNFTNMIENRTKSIQYANIETLCLLNKRWGLFQLICCKTSVPQISFRKAPALWYNTSYQT